MNLTYPVLSLFTTVTALGQTSPIEQRLAELERRVATLEQSANAKPDAPVISPLAIAAIYEAKSEADAMVAAKKYVSGIWSSTGYKTSGAGFKWMKWDFSPDGSMLFHSAFSTDGKWEAQKRTWKIGTGRLRESGQLVYLVELEPAPNGSIILQRNGSLEWATGEFECAFQRGDQFATPSKSPDK